MGKPALITLSRKKDLILIFALAIVVGLVFRYYSDISPYMSIDSIRIYKDEWILYYRENVLTTLGLYFIFNFIMASLPIPGITVISFLGGVLFGPLIGIILSSLATALGNLVGFFLGRYFFRDYIRAKYSHRIKIFNEDWKKEGAIALFSFRVFPLVPSFVATLIMSVTAMSWMTFFLVSWFGRIPMVVVYAWAGDHLSEITSAKDILSPQLIFSFFILSISPWIFKAIKKRLAK